MTSLSVDDVLLRLGGHGRFQNILLLCTSYMYMWSAGFHLMVITFIAGEPTWECVQNSTHCNLTGPVSTVNKHYKDRCSMPRSEWKFSDIYTSTVTEYDLVCDDSILQSVASSVYWIGWLLGNVFIGYLSDKYGRKHAAKLSTFLVFLFTWIIVWPKGLWVFIVCRLMTGVGSGGICMCCFIYLVEFSPSKNRGSSGSLLWLAGPASYSLMGLFAYLIRDWRYLMLCAAAMATSAAVIPWFLPETPRYLLVHGKYKEARNVLELVARWNKKEMPSEDIIIPKKGNDEKSDLRDLFHDRKVTVMTITTWFSWFTVALVFYVVSYSAVYLGGNVYLSVFLTNIILFPAIPTTIFGINKFGRKKAVILGLIVSAMACVVNVFIPTDRSDSGFTAGRIIVAMAGKFFIYISFVTIYVQGAEVFPTTVRNIAMGTASGWGRVGSFIALYILWLERVYFLLPYVIMGVLCLVSAVTCHLFIPETKEIITREVFEYHHEKQLAIAVSGESNEGLKTDK